MGAIGKLDLQPSIIEHHFDTPISHIVTTLTGLTTILKTYIGTCIDG